MNVYRHLILCSILCILFLQTGCEKPQSETASPTPTATLAAVSTPLPTAIPAPTPVPEGPGFHPIRLNREIMTPEQTHKYGQDMAGKQVVGWIGYFHSILESDESGKSRVVIDMDQNEGGIPDVVLEGISSEIAAQLKPRQELNFSGSILGYVSIPDSLYTLSLGEVSIYGF